MALCIFIEGLIQSIGNLFTWLNPFLKLFGIALIVNWILMLVPTYIFCVFLGPFLEPRRIQKDKEKIIRGPGDVSPQLIRELKTAVGTTVGGLAMVFIVKYLEAHQYVRPNNKNCSLPTTIVEFLVYFAAFDFYYYMLHRFFLHSKFGWWIHKHHHKSFFSAPSTGFSFHPLEALITGGFNPLLAYLLNFHQSTVIVCQVYGISNTIFVHLGYEIVPRWWYSSPFTRWYLSSVFHDVHHSKVHCNFGGFTTIYDYLFGTVHHDFENLVNSVFVKKNQ